MIARASAARKQPCCWCHFSASLRISASLRETFRCVKPSSGEDRRSTRISARRCKVAKYLDFNNQIGYIAAAFPTGEVRTGGVRSIASPPPPAGLFRREYGRGDARGGQSMPPVQHITGLEGRMSGSPVVLDPVHYRRGPAVARRISCGLPRVLLRALTCGNVDPIKGRTGARCGMANRSVATDEHPPAPVRACPSGAPTVWSDFFRGVIVRVRRRINPCRLAIEPARPPHSAKHCWPSHRAVRSRQGQRHR